MNINKIVREINEGVYDPTIFKAIFLAGGPGSGKSTTAKAVTAGQGWKIVASDEIFEKMMKDAKIESTPEFIASPEGVALRGLAKVSSSTRQGNLVAGRLGIILDGTGKNLTKVAQQKKDLNSLGYQTYMIYVNTTLETAIERDKHRDRSLGKELVTKLWHETNNNHGTYQTLFGRNYIEVDGNLDHKDPKAKKVNDALWKTFMKVAKLPHVSVTAKKWIADELAARKRK